MTNSSTIGKAPNITDARILTKTSLAVIAHQRIEGPSSAVGTACNSLTAARWPCSRYSENAEHQQQCARASIPPVKALSAISRAEANLTTRLALMFMFLDGSPSQVQRSISAVTPSRIRREFLWRNPGPLNVSDIAWSILELAENPDCPIYSGRLKQKLAAI